ncbi:MAG: hypothetical protein M1830_006046, partial [Pleopsidium flavum]
MNLTIPAKLDALDALFPPLTSPHLLCLSLLILLPACHLIYKDYTAFLSLGPGGTPSTFSGYLRICFLRLFALKDPYTPVPIPNIIRPHSSYLHGMPKRPGPRPQVAGIAPHRQTIQKSSASVFAALSNEIATLADLHPDRLCV